MKLFKTLIISALLMLFIPKFTIAQTFEAGAAVGFNMSQIDGDALFGFRRIGVATGPILNINTARRWQLSTGILYSQLGSARGKYDGPGDFDKIRANYVEVPLIMRFKDWKGEYENEEYMRLGFEAGVTYGRLINFTAIDIGGSDITDFQNFNTSAININFGATYYINPKWGVHAKWSKQLNDLDNNAGVMVNRYINVMLYYFL